MDRTRGTRARWYPLLAAVLSLGAPAGLRVLRWLYLSGPPFDRTGWERITYVYVFLITAAVLTSLGYMLGRQADRLAALSDTDGLTGLLNRRALRRRLAEELRRAARYGTPMSLLLIDIDHLKEVNDRQGHADGDRLLRSVSRTIQVTLRTSDFGGRWGGDEFAVLAPNTALDAARAIAERLVRRVANTSRIGTSPCSISVGVATFDPLIQRSFGLESLMRSADRALYRAKAGGRNCVMTVEH